MKVFQSVYNSHTWSQALPINASAELVLLFGNEALIEDAELYTEIQLAFPKAHVVGCTTSGEIQADTLLDDSLVLSAIHVDQACIYVESEHISHFDDAEALGESLIKGIPKHVLRHVFLISDGQQINGSDLVSGVQRALPEGVSFTGGLAGDKSNFSKTKVRHNKQVDEGLVAAICFYGESLEIATGCYGGWRAFGPEREITKADKNVVYEIDGKPALALYKSFLGEYAQDLPGSALLYPLSLTEEDGAGTVVRTILSIDEEQNSMRFAGNMPVGSTCQLMHASTEQLLDGAELAAKSALLPTPLPNNTLALLVSCVGRRLVMSKRAVEEIELIHDVMPENAVLTGFYSYGEISPLSGTQECTLHNQTMTITVIGER